LSLRGKREEGRGKREEGRGKREEGRGERKVLALPAHQEAGHIGEAFPESQGFGSATE
jgi:hypothetical protein